MGRSEVLATLWPELGNNVYHCRLCCFRQYKARDFLLTFCFNTTTDFASCYSLGLHYVDKHAPTIVMDEFAELLGLEITTLTALADKSDSCPFAPPMSSDSDW